MINLPICFWFFDQGKIGIGINIEALGDLACQHYTIQREKKGNFPMLSLHANILVYRVDAVESCGEKKKREL